MNPFLVPVRKIGFAGDWHANRRYACSAVRRLAEQDVSHILHTGDFGWLFQPSFIDPLEEALARHDIHLMFADGNHEDFSYLDALTDPQITPHIRHIRRGERWEWDGIRFVGLGGAHSVDRPNRRPGISWWPQETIGYQDLEKIAEGGQADVMLTHDCPTGVTIPGIEGNPYGFHPMELALADEHRDVVLAAVDIVRPKLLVHGHYHERYTAVLDRMDQQDPYRTLIQGLSMDGGPFAENLLITTLREIDQLTV